MSGKMEKQAVIKNEFEPDWASPPGDTIQDLLDTSSASQAYMRRVTKLSPDEWKALIKGDHQIDSRLAKVLSKTLGGSEEFWATREKQYREALERCKKGDINVQTKS